MCFMNSTRCKTMNKLQKTNNQWALVAAQHLGRMPREAWEHYEALVADVDLIERGAVDVPASWDDIGGGGGGEERAAARRAGPTRPRPEKRRTGIPWSEEEHRYFPVSIGSI